MMLERLFRRAADRDVRHEIETHIEMRAELNEETGMEAGAARHAALRQFGSVAEIREQIYDQNRYAWLDQFSRDVAYVLRSLRRRPGFTAGAVLTLTLGIGVNTAIFSIVNAVLLEPIPLPDPDRLVAIENTSNGTPYGPWTSPAKFMHWRAQTDVFSDVAAFDQIPRQLNYAGEPPQQVTAIQVSESYFRVLGAPLVHGRPFTLEEDLPGGPKVSVVSYDFWQDHLGGAEDVLGQTLVLDEGAYTVVGIVAEDFDLSEFAGYGGNPDLWVPFQLDPNTAEEANYFVNMARLEPGVPLELAQARVAASAAEFRQRFPRMPETEGFTVRPAQQTLTMMYGDPHARLWILVAAVGFVLLIACANVANLLLVRGIGRRWEIAIRSALGAGRGSIVRQLLTESLLLSLAGGASGLVVGFLGIRALLAVNTAGFPRLGPGGSLVDMDWRVATFTLGLSLTTCLLVGLVPAIIGSRTDPNVNIRDSRSPSGGGLRQAKMRSLLVGLEVGLAVVLLVGAAMLIRTSVALGRVDPGFDPSNVLTMSTIPSGSRFPTARALSPTVRAGLEGVRSLPGVQSAAVTRSLPLGGGPGLPFDIVSLPDGPQHGSATYVTSSEGYFATFGIPLIHGRAFTALDDVGGLPVAIINESMARRFWPDGRDPLDDRILIGAGIPELGGGPERRIVGIVGDVRQNLSEDPRPTMYVPVTQSADNVYTLIANTGAPMTWAVRTRDETAALAAAVKDSLGQATGLPVGDVQPMARLISASVSRERLNMLLMSVFGGAAVLLASIGIYGLVAYSVLQRTQEIGIRMALGGDPEHMKRILLRQGMLLVTLGIAAGLLAAFSTADVLASLLFNVSPRDPAVFATVPLAVGLIAFASLWIPARRVSRVDPVTALRHDA